MKKLLKLLCCCFLLVGCKTEEENPIKKEENVVLVSNETYEDPKNPSNTFKKAFNLLTEHVNAQDMEKVSGVEIQKILDEYIAKIDKIASEKEKEVMSV